MKKVILFALALTLILSLAACGSTPAGSDPADPVPAPSDPVQPDPAAEENTDEPSVGGMPNPMTAYDSLDAINSELGVKLCSPAVMGVSDKAYFIYDLGDYRIAEEQFTANGLPFSFRCSPIGDKDISGLYLDNGTAFEGQGISDEIQYAANAEYQAARWFTIDGQYVLSVTDNGALSEETFLGIAEELRAGTQPGSTVGDRAAYYAELEGLYQDTVSQRATAEVTANGGDSVTIVVHWSSSASEYDQWTVKAALAEDGLLCYNEEHHSRITMSADGTKKEERLNDPVIAGWFAYGDGLLSWTGANSEQCRECVFEKMDVLVTDVAAPNP